MSVSGALFDMVKLLDVGKTVISKFTAEEVYEKAMTWAKKYDNELEEMLKDKNYALKIFGIERGNQKPRKDIAKWSDVKESIIYMYDNKFLDENIEYPYQTINEKDDINKILKLYTEKYYDENDDKQTWFNKIKELSGEMGFAKEVANRCMFFADTKIMEENTPKELFENPQTPRLQDFLSKVL